jgi:hypothetical protein
MGRDYGRPEAAVKASEKASPGAGEGVEASRRTGILYKSRRLMGSNALRLLVVALFAAAAAIPSWSPPPPTPLPLVGFSFSPKTADYLGEDPGLALSRLLEELHPDLVRLPVYWDDVAPAPDLLDFGPVDEMLDRVRQYDLTRDDGGARVMLVVGARNIAYPEQHLPAWVTTDSVPDAVRLPQYSRYVLATVARYEASPLVYAWQVENEPLDDVHPEGAPDASLDAGFLAAEVADVRAADPSRPIVVTTFDSSTLSLDLSVENPLLHLLGSLPGQPRPAGHPFPTLDLADVLGLDVYVVTPSTPLEETSAARRIGWKQQALDWWSLRAQASGKQLWVTEMQGAPWDGTEGFTTADLKTSAKAYQQVGAGVVLLWGVESWLLSDDWMVAGREAVTTLRTPPDRPGAVS